MENQMQSVNGTRCTGCRYRMSIWRGGYGILCTQNTGKCPTWVINNAIDNGVAPLIYTGKNFTDKQLAEWDEKLMEYNRL